MTSIAAVAVDGSGGGVAGAGGASLVVGAGLSLGVGRRTRSLGGFFVTVFLDGAFAPLDSGGFGTDAFLGTDRFAAMCVACASVFFSALSFLRASLASFFARLKALRAALNPAFAAWARPRAASARLAALAISSFNCLAFARDSAREGVFWRLFMVEDVPVAFAGME